MHHSFLFDRFPFRFGRFPRRCVPAHGDLLCLAGAWITPLKPASWALLRGDVAQCRKRECLKMNYNNTITLRLYQTAAIYLRICINTV